MKQRLTLAIAGLLFITFLKGQQVTRAEYYFNTDPGQGSGTALTFTAGDSVIITNNIILPGNLPQGINTIYFRTANNNGVWSFSESSLLWVNTSLKKLRSFEYFFDADPGLGSGTVTSFPPADSINLTQNIVLPGSLQSGLHLLFTRVQNEAGVWSMPEVYLVNIQAGSQMIVAAEYFIDTDPGLGAGTAVTVNSPADSVTLIQHITLPALSNGPHTLYVRTKNQSGTWSFPESHALNICNAYGPLSGFSYLVNGSEVYFSDSSTNSNSHKWLFGDGTSDTAVNPRHLFSAGNYNTRLITTNACGTDTLTKMVSIRGIQQITPGFAPATGIYIGYIQGVGFKPGSVASLSKSGSPVIVADSTVFIDSTVLKAVFLNKNEDLGKYDLIVHVPSSPDLSLDTAVTIQTPVPAEMWVRLEGRKAVQRNIWTSFHVVFGNRGNQAVAQFPIAITVPGNIDAKIVNPMIDSFIVPAVRPSLPEGRFYTAVDSVTNDSVKICYLIIPYLEAGATGNLTLEVRSASMTDFYIKTFAGRPWQEDSTFLTGKSGRGNNVTSSFCNPPNCTKCLLDIIGFTPGACIPASYNFLCSAYNGLMDYKNHKSTASSTAIDFTGNTGSWILSCIGGTVTGTLKKVAEGLDKATNGKSMLDNCASCRPIPPQADTIPVRFSLDPNEKYGPTGYNALRYTRWQDPFSYSIHFENIATATAPAREVLITDQIDTSRLDIHTLRFTGFGFADTSFLTSISDSIFIRDVDLRPAKNSIARVTGRLDSLNKLSVHFETFDPGTMALTSSINDGFLNPNINGTEGQGYIGYQISPKPDLPTGTLINNQAAVIFDNNAPVITNTWFNSIDKEKPSSNVLPVTERINDSTYNIGWTGTDNHAGISFYRIMVSVNDSAWRIWRISDSTHEYFNVKTGFTYKIYSIAEDFLGNTEDPPGTPDQILTAVLPVKLVSFNVLKQDRSALLRWTTAFEQKNKGFEIGRSTDGVHFNRIGWVQGAGNSNTLRSYSFLDASPAKGLNFYRLRQLDMDERAEYSEVRKVDFGQTVDFSIFPNPVTNTLTIRFTSPISRIRIMDMEGRVLHERSDLSGTGPLNLPVSSLASGSYLLEIEDRNGSTAIQKFIKH